MLPFALAATVLTILAIAAIAWPLLRKHSPALSEADANLALYREEKARLESAAASGALGDAQRSAAIEELTSRLAEELANEAKLARGAGFSPRTRYAIALASAILLPLAAAALYFVLGTPGALRPEAAALAARGGPTAEQVVALVDKLAARMQENPGDPAGWRLLARSQAALGRLGEAAIAYEKANALAPGDPDLLADWADVLAASEDGRLAGKPYEIALRALAIDPAHVKALALAATAELQENRLELARRHATALLARMPKDSEDAQRVQALIAEIDRQARSGAPPRSDQVSR